MSRSECVENQRAIAREVYEKGRQKEYVFDPGQEEYDTLMFVKDDGSSKLLSDPQASTKILPLICPNWKREEMNDILLMERFLESNTASTFPSCKENLLDEIPAQVPLLRSLEHDFQANRYSYVYPLKHCRDLISASPTVDARENLPKQLMEIDLVNSSFVDQINFLEKINSFKDMNYFEFPIQFVPFTAHSVDVPQSTYDNIVSDHKNMRDTSAQPINREYSTRLEDDYNRTPLLCRIAFGDGIRWAATIKLPWTPSSDDRDSIEVYVSHLDPCSPLMLLMKGMNCLLGHSANLDRMLIMQTLSSIYGITDELPPALEIDALMLLNGSMFPVLSPFTNHYLVTGSLINDQSVGGDGKWHEELNSLPDELEVLIVQGLRSAFSCGVVLFASLVRNMFPDSDCVCHTLGLSQAEWLMYFGGLIMSIACNKLVHEDSRDSLQAYSRMAHIKCLFPFEDCTVRPYLSFEILREDPNLIIFCEMLPPWPNIIKGGARSIHQVRIFFLKQYDVLKKLRFAHRSLHPDLFRLSTHNTYENFEKDITFGQAYDSSNGVLKLCKTTLEGLSPDKHFDHKQFIFDEYDFSSKALEREGQRVSRYVGTGLLEYARTHPQLINRILLYMRNSDPNSENMRLYMKKPRIYERLRDMYRNIYAKPPVVVPAIEDIIDQRGVNSLDHLQRAEKTVRKSGKESESDCTNRILRTDAAERNLHGGRTNRVDNQTRILDKLPALSRRERKGRSLSCFRAQKATENPVVTFSRDCAKREVSLGRSRSRSRSRKRLESSRLAAESSRSQKRLDYSHYSDNKYHDSPRHYENSYCDSSSRSEAETARS